MDFRLIGQTASWMEREHLMRDADVVSLAGSSKSLVDGDEETKNVLLKQIDISHSLHDSCTVYLVHHSSCGAYAISNSFSSKEEEKKKQSEDLQKAVLVINERFPDLKVKKIWVDMKDSDGTEVEITEI